MFLKVELKKLFQVSGLFTKMFEKTIDFRFLPMMQSWSISADFRLYDCFASLSSVYYTALCLLCLKTFKGLLFSPAARY